MKKMTMAMAITFGESARTAVILAGVALATLPGARAQTSPTAAGGAGDQTVLHLSATAQRDVPRDLLIATLAAAATDPDPAKVQGDINRRMAAALARSKQVPDVAVETTGYTVYREPDEKPAPDKAPPRWHGSQSITLSGKDFAALFGLVGTLQQQGLVMQNLVPDLSRDGRQTVEDALTGAALNRLQQRAERVAAALDTRVARFRSITVGNVNPPPPIIRPMAMMARSDNAVSSPVAEPGSATVSVTVEADIALAPR